MEIMEIIPDDVNSVDSINVIDVLDVDDDKRAYDSYVTRHQWFFALLRLHISI